jgi:hypothetical protein
MVCLTLVDSVGVTQTERLIKVSGTDSLVTVTRRDTVTFTVVWGTVTTRTTMTIGVDELQREKRMGLDVFMRSCYSFFHCTYLIHLITYISILGFTN